MTNENKIKPEIIIGINIFIQMFLIVFSGSLISKTNNEANIFIYLCVLLSIINLFNFIIYTLNNRKHLALESNIIFFITIIYIFISGINIEDWNFYIFRCLILFQLIISYIDVLSENLINLKRIRISIFMYIIIMYIVKSLFFKIFTSLIQIFYLLMSLLPVVLIIRNYETLKRIGTNSYRWLKTISFILFVLLSSPFFIFLPSFSLTNLNEYIMFIFLELTKIIFISVSIWRNIFLKRFHFSWELIIIFYTLLSLFIMLKINILISLSITTMIIIVVLEIYIFKKFKEIKNAELNDLFIDDLKYKEFIKKQEELHFEKTIIFLHDEILQNIIIALRELKDDRHCDKKSDVVKVLEETNLKIRQEINLYKPKIGEKENIFEVYSNLMEEIQNRFNREDILIDFNCAYDLKLYKPYDSIIYRFLHELIMNILKHSNGYYSEVNIEKNNEILLLKVINHGDYMESINYKDKGSVGLQTLKLNAQRLGGKMDISVKSENLMGGQESMVLITVELPIRKEEIYENFINRRS